MVPAGTYGMMVPGTSSRYHTGMMVPGTRYLVLYQLVPYVPAAAAAAAAAGVWLETKDKPIPVLD